MFAKLHLFLFVSLLITAPAQAGGAGGSPDREDFEQETEFLS